MSHNLHTGKKVGHNRFLFSTNGDSFMELLRQAGCTAPTGLVHVMSGNCSFSSFDDREYEVFPVQEEQTALDFLSFMGGCPHFASTREMLRFIADFPDIARSFKRMPMFGRDYITLCNPGSIPTFRPTDDGFELYLESRQTLWSSGDGPLMRIPSPPKGIDINYPVA